MEQVIGIGGVFFKSTDPTALTRWYVDKLGLPQPAGSDPSVLFRWMRIDEPHAATCTVWSPFPQATDYFQPSTASFMINFQVRDLDAMLAQLRAAGAVVDPRVEDTPYGRFGWCQDPEGNRIELWQPVSAREDLLQSIEAWRDLFERTVLSIPAERRETPGVEGDLALKDLVAHVLFWERRALTLLHAARAGEKAPSLRRPDEGDNWIHRLNADIYAESRSKSWDQVWADWAPTGAEMRETVAGLTDHDLFAPDGFARFFKTPGWDIVANNTFDHYSEHLISIRSWSGSQL